MVERSIDKAAVLMLKRTEKLGIETVYDRFEAQQPQCKFGELGICCRNCNMGPCRIDPFGEGAQKGCCGATADTIVARNLLRAIAAGAAAHSDHGRDVALTLLAAAEGHAPYEIRDEEKLKAVAAKLGIELEGKTKEELAKEVAKVALNDFSKQTSDAIKFTSSYAPKKRIEVWKKLGVLPRNIDREIVEAMHRTHIGVDADPVNLILHCLRTAIGDGWGGSLIATELQDILFGTPEPIESELNLGALEENKVNIIIHGHEPILSEKILEAVESKEMQELAREAGAEGINLLGMCCTGNELLMRHGIAVAGNFLHQELAIATGAVEAVIVDVQCIMPALTSVADCFHTKVITTSYKAKIPEALHIEFSEDRADEVAREIVRVAVENFRNRKKERVFIPEEKRKALVGFSVEAILKALGGSLEPLVNAIKEGKILGIVAIVGCNNPKVKQDYNHVELTKELIKSNVLVIGTGCWAIAAGKAGLLTKEAVELAGDGLKSVCKSLGIPPCLHMGSCVDISRIEVAAAAIADYLGVDISDLPVAGSAPEWMSEKAVSIGTYVVADGILTHLGTVPQVTGSKLVVKILTQDAEALIGGKFLIEKDPKKAARHLIDHLKSKRKALGI